MTYQLLYLDYKDLATGKTLVVTPGSAYTIALSSGRNAAAPAYPNDGRWTSVSAFTSYTAEPAAPPVTKKQAADMTTAESSKNKEGADNG